MLIGVRVPMGRGPRPPAAAVSTDRVLVPEKHVQEMVMYFVLLVSFCVLVGCLYIRRMLMY